VTNRRIFSFGFPRLGADRLLRRLGDLHGAHFAVLEDAGQMQIISALCPLAEAPGDTGVAAKCGLAGTSGAAWALARYAGHLGAANAARDHAWHSTVMKDLIGPSGVRDYWDVATNGGARLRLFYAHGAALSPGWCCQGQFA
jgi:hypothetical protein